METSLEFKNNLTKILDLQPNLSRESILNFIDNEVRCEIMRHKIDMTISDAKRNMEIIDKAFHS